VDRHTTHRTGRAHDHTSERGFTLVEILISIVLVGILSAVVVVGIGSLTSKGEASACAASRDAAQAGASTFWGSTGAQAATFTAMTTTNPPALTLPTGATVSPDGRVLSTTNWTLTLSPNTAVGGAPSFVCSTDVPVDFVVGPNGRAYRFVSAPGISHASATTAAAGFQSAGRTGHLATITSAAEHNFIVSLLGTSSAWVSGADTGTEGTWRWTSGPEAGQQFANGVASVGGSYVNWNVAQPDNAGGNEHCMHLHAPFGHRWNDVPCGWTLNAGYVVEIGG
jgi:prepilin-type N-terminal cleavage/methylation domain-containing protein